MACFLNRKFVGKKLVNSLIILSYVIPSVCLIFAWRYMFNNIYGIINYIVVDVLHLAKEVPLWFDQPVSAFILAALFCIWRFFPYAYLSFTAILQTIDKSLYEAAAADGAGRFKRIWHVTLPGIRTTVALLAILSLGNVLNAGFDQIYNLYNPLVYSTGDVIDTWVYRAGLQNLQYSLATAVGLFKSVISVILIALGYRLADKFTGYKLF